MSDGQKAAGSGASRKAYSATMGGKELPGTSCSFCWFVLKLYPTLKELTDRDTVTFRTHLEKVHGLTKEIEQ